MTQVKDLYEALHALAPFDLQESYDNAGILVGSETTEIKGVLVSLDATPEVIEEARELGCNVVVSHHPILFSGVKRLNGKTYIERTIIHAIKYDIVLIAIHTNLDNVLYKGVNTKIAEKLGVTECRPLLPIENPYSERLVGSGLIGELTSAMPSMEFLAHVKSSMNASCVKYTKIVKDEVKTIALCGGSGRFLLPYAIAEGADVFLTSDIKYHEFFDADGHLVLVDIGHYESEQFTIDLLYDFIKKNFSIFAAHYTKVNTNPIKYL